jgi:NRAMP (natural resistance-associated macrophage protein)-like metal ion transporter
VSPRRSAIRRYLRALGPGLITGAADDDPSGIATYSQAGAAFGFGLLWTALVSFPLMVGVQLLCARIGLVCRCGLASVLRTHYPAWVLWFAATLLFIGNTVNIAADLGAMAAGVRLATGISGWWVVAVLAALMLGFLMYGSYHRIAGVFKLLTLSLFAYVGAALLAHPDWLAVLRGTLLPRVTLSKDYLLMFVAVLGTTISPYLFFWEAAQTVEDEQAVYARARPPSRRTIGRHLRTLKIDVVTGMGFSNVIMYFIILTTGATLHVAGKTDIQTAEQAASALRPLAGPAAATLFALGLIGTGLLAVPVLAGSAAFAIAEGAEWPRGMGETPRTAGRFFGVIAIALGLGTAITFTRIDAIKLLIWSAVVNGLLAPPLIVIVLLVCNNAAIMGRRRNGRLLNVLGGAAAVLMGIAGLALVASWIS